MVSLSRFFSKPEVAATGVAGVALTRAKIELRIKIKLQLRREMMTTSTEQEQHKKHLFSEPTKALAGNTATLKMVDKLNGKSGILNKSCCRENLLWFAFNYLALVLNINKR